MPGWRRIQGIVFRRGDARFEGRNAPERWRLTLADPECMMVQSKPECGRASDQPIARPDAPRWLLEPASLTQCSRAAVVQNAPTGASRSGRSAASAAGLGFIPLTQEHFDFALVTDRKERVAVQAFLAACCRLICRTRWSGRDSVELADGPSGQERT